MEKEKQTETKKAKLKTGFVSGTGRRKTATARVFLWKEKGKHIINGKDCKEYFPSEKEQIKLMRPFYIVGVSHPETKYTISVKVSGSGRSAQLDAVIHGISRVLAQFDPEFQVALRKSGLLTRDSRMVERKKPNLHKARRAHQFSKR